MGHTMRLSEQTRTIESPVACVNIKRWLPIGVIIWYIFEYNFIWICLFMIKYQRKQIFLWYLIKKYKEILATFNKSY